MGFFNALFDALSGRNYALHNVVLPKTSIYLKYSLNFPVMSFKRDYFGYLSSACDFFIRAHYVDEPENAFKKNIKQITPNTAFLLIKLLGMNHILWFLRSKNNVSLIKKLKISPLSLKEDLIKCVQMSSYEINLFNKLSKTFEDNKFDYLDSWVYLFHSKVLKVPTPDNTLLTEVLLGESFILHIKKLSRKLQDYEKKGLYWIE